MIFQSQEYLLWLFALPAALTVYLIRVRLRERILRRHLGRRKSALLKGISESRRRAKAALAFLALPLLAFALARPQTEAEGEKEEIKSAGVYMLFLIDVSRSMLAEDVRPSRLAFMKKELSRLLDMSAGDMAGIVAFARPAVMVTPFTPDLSAAKAHLQDLSPDYFSSQGTSFERAFALAKKAFQSAADKKWKKAVKALIIASDGEDHSPAAKEKIRSLLKENIRVFALSFGTKRGGLIPLRDYRGKLIEYKKDAAGEPVVTRLRPSSLKSFARIGKGAYYHASYGGRAISRLREDLDQMEKTVFKSVSVTQRKELYQWLLLAAFLLAFSEIMLGERRRLRAAEASPQILGEAEAKHETV